MLQQWLLQKRFNYAHVGITEHNNLADAPSQRGRVSEETAQIGSGPDRWDHAWKQTLSWGIQRDAGYSIQSIGQPNPNRDREQHNHPESPYPKMRPGQTVQLRRRFGPLIMAMPIRVVYVVDEPQRKGFAFGTLSGHPVSGEVAFIVEHREDDSVHFVLRSFSGPGKGLWVLAYPIVLLLRGGLRDTYLKSLAGPLS